MHVSSRVRTAHADFFVAPPVKLSIRVRFAHPMSALR